MRARKDSLGCVGLEYSVVAYDDYPVVEVAGSAVAAGYE